MKIYLIVGEPSGDILASRLIKAIRHEHPEAQFFGIGGETMRIEGFNSLFDIKDLSVMGVMEVIPRLPVILRRRKEVLNDIERVQPDVIVTVDSWGFISSVLKILKKRKNTIPVVHYVAPQVWAWKKGRAKKAAKLMNHLMTLLPNEPQYFEKYGLPCTFVGHPVIENIADLGFGSAQPPAPLSERSRTAENARILCVLPGSRHSEVSKLAPVFVESIKQLHKEIPNLFLFIPSVETMKDEINEHFKNIGTPYKIITGQQARYEAFRMSEFALAASGTVSLELTACGTPHIIAYTFNWLTNRMAEFFVKIKFANLINILADRLIIPEFVLRNCRSDLIVPEALSFFQDKEKGEIQMMQAKEQLAKLKPADKLPSEKAAEVVVKMISS
ncbi:MAG: lipid-A-disaccharide synthase [Dysgonamonadaceae bacterium]|jgi:lipid-A-disaccharide synthase|nr:lipid-A-disaccharide synthase [Dysgonamonadaceae bacterium]